jgi:hypothetical protein
MKAPPGKASHAIVTNNDLWIAATAWGVAIFLVGIAFFWQAEAPVRPRLTPTASPPRFKPASAS